MKIITQIESTIQRRRVAGEVPPRRNYAIPVLILFAAILISGLVMGVTVKRQKAASKPRISVLTVRAQRPQNRTVEGTLDVQGTISAREPILVSSTLSGLEVKAVLCDEGAIVKAGQILAKLDTTQLTAELHSAQARLKAAQAFLKKSLQPNRIEELTIAEQAVEQAQASLSDCHAAVAMARARQENAAANKPRYQKLYAEGAIAAQEAENAETQLKVADQALRSEQEKEKASLSLLRQCREKLAMARAGGRMEDVEIARAQVDEMASSVEHLKLQLARALIRSPVDGLIARRDVHLGEVSVASKLMFIIDKDCQTELQAEVPDGDLKFVRPGQAAMIDATLLGANVLQGRVREISPIIDPATKVAKVRIDVQPNSVLRAGSYVEGRIKLGPHSALTVPARSVCMRGEKSCVFVIHSNKIEERVVQASPTSRSFTEILSGLEANESIVSEGAGFLKDGDTIAIVP